MVMCVLNQYRFDLMVFNCAGSKACIRNKILLGHFNQASKSEERPRDVAKIETCAKVTFVFLRLVCVFTVYSDIFTKKASILLG